MRKPIRLGVLVSGEGTNLQALIDAISRKELNAEIVCVLSNKPNAPVLERSKKAGIFAKVLTAKFASQTTAGWQVCKQKSSERLGRNRDTMNGFSDRTQYDIAVAEELIKHKVELVILAGFMRIVSKAFLDYFPNRVINIHPALLPDNMSEDSICLPDGTVSKVFRGLHVVEETLAAKVKWSGATIHLVTPDVDRGPVLEREAVQVLSGDTVETLHARIKEAEHRLLPRAVAQYAKK